MSIEPAFEHPSAIIQKSTDLTERAVLAARSVEKTSPVVARWPDLPGCAVRVIYTAEPYVEAAVHARLRPHGILPHMNKSDLNAIKEIVDSALGTHLASVHEEITDLRNELKQEVNELKRDLIPKGVPPALPGWQ